MRFVTSQTISSTFLERVKLTPNSVGFQYKPTYNDPQLAGSPIAGGWKEVTFKQFHSECRLMSFGLMGLGVSQGDRVAILSNTRFEWSLMDMAILGARGVTVPIYSSNTAEDASYIINHSEAKILILEDAKQLQKILDLRQEKPDALPHLEKIVAIEPSAMSLASSHLDGTKDVLTLQALRELGRREEAKEPPRFDQNLQAARPGDLITICYTSGTTGIPKGAMLTHDNMMSVLEDCVQTIARFLRGEQSILSFLPFSHVLGKVESMTPYAFGWRQVFSENLDKLMSNMREVKPTVIFAVPRIFEKAFARVKAAMDSASPPKRKLFDWALERGQRYYSAVWAKRAPSVRDAAEYAIAKRVVFSKIQSQFGGKLKYAVCGGAPLPKEIGEFFEIIGLEIIEGYGLTETCAPISFNPPEDIRFGTVGKPLAEVTLKVADDGELLVKSRKVFAGYYKMPRETEEAVDDGWFHTGDIGHIDSDGYIHITDRKKDLIVTSGGKNIAPQKIENLAKSQKFITQFVVHGDRRNYLTALVTLDREQVIPYANENQILFSEYTELVKHPKILSLVQKIIDEINRHLASYETIKKFIILPNEFTVESGELTPSLKVRRNRVSQRYRSELDSMYAGT